MDETEAIARLKRCDLTGMEALVISYQEKAVHTAYLIVQDRALAEDVVSGAFLRAYEKIGQFDNTRPFGPWFLRSVIHTAIKTANRQKRFILPNADSNDEFFLVEDPHPHPEQLVEMADDREAVQRALNQLSSRERAAVVMRYYLEFSEAEMVNETQQPLSTIKWLLRSARKHLRGMLQQRFISGSELDAPPQKMDEGGK